MHRQKGTPNIPQAIKEEIVRKHTEGISVRELAEAYHEAILLACFFHLTTQGKVQDYLTLTDAQMGFGKFDGPVPLPKAF